jgi:hypothetical protein
MTTKTIDMPDVDACDARDCAYNKEGNCHARAITVGDGVHPGCDTFLQSQEHSRRAEGAGVGACKVKACKHNDDFECQAGSIRVGRRSGTIECLTFTSR